MKFSVLDSLLYAPDSFGELRELAVAESQLARRSVRLDCGDDGAGNGSDD